MPYSNHPSNTPLPEESVSDGTYAGLIKLRGERHMSLAPQMPATATSRTEANSSTASRRRVHRRDRLPTITDPVDNAFPAHVDVRGVEVHEADTEAFVVEFALRGTLGHPPAGSFRAHRVRLGIGARSGPRRTGRTQTSPGSSAGSRNKPSSVARATPADSGRRATPSRSPPTPATSSAAPATAPSPVRATATTAPAVSFWLCVVMRLSRLPRRFSMSVGTRQTIFRKHGIRRIVGLAVSNADLRLVEPDGVPERQHCIRDFRRSFQHCSRTMVRNRV